jgi:hypothetical protein
MGAGFIYLIIVGLWVAYFLPRWISSHEEHLGRSIDRYQALLDAVGRTATGTTSRYLSPEERDDRQHTRRISFLALSVLLLVTILLTSLGLLSPALLSVPIIGFTSYILVVRRQIAMEQRVKETEKLYGPAKLENSLVRDKSEIYRSKYAELIVSAQHLESEEQWTPLAERERAFSQESNSSQSFSGIVLLPKGSAESRDTWQPTPVPAPTYLSSSRIAPTRRVIDLTNPGAWSSKNHPQGEEELRALEEAALEAIAPNPDQIFDQEIAEEAAERISRLRRAN